VRDVGVAEERVERPEAEHLEADLLDELLALAPAEELPLGLEEALKRAADVLLGLHAVERGERDHVETLEQEAVDASLELLEARPAGRVGARGAALRGIAGR